jgi:hypothetical protein
LFILNNLSRLTGTHGTSERTCTFVFLFSATTLYLLFLLTAATMPPKPRKQQKKNDEEALAPTSEQIPGNPGPSTSARGSKKAGAKPTGARKTEKNPTEPATRSRSTRGTRVVVQVAGPSSKQTSAMGSTTTKRTRQDDIEDVTMDDETTHGEQVGKEPDRSENGNEEDVGAGADAGELDAEDLPHKGKPKTEEEKVRV